MKSRDSPDDELAGVQQPQIKADNSPALFRCVVGMKMRPPFSNIDKSEAGQLSSQNQTSQI
jgi:hypothetical protein